jgi:hypothetical protein
MVVVLRIIALLLTWGPLVLSSIKEVEILLSDKSGAEKKKAAHMLIQTGLTSRGIEITKSTESMISGLIEFVVSVLNAWNNWKS